MPSLNWIGKSAVVTHHKDVPFRLLEPVPELSAGAEDSENLIVQGDNLHALKALLPRYAGQVKCIYIDPPYNTGNEGWAYNDNVNSPEIRKWLGEVVGKEGETLDRHDRWLCMMYPRLLLLKQFLREDGVIFISIDDTEVGNLRVLMDEIFGARNFIASIAWQRRTSPDSRLGLSQAHDHILIAAKHADLVQFNPIPLSPDQAKKYTNQDNDERGPWTSTDFTAQGWRPNQMYKITVPGGATYDPPPGRCWANVESVFEQLVRDGKMWFGKSGNSRPRIKTYLHETSGVKAWSWWSNTDCGHNQEAKKELNEILGHATAFDTPKPTRLIQRILQVATDKDSVVMDSFAGSGTTGHAVLKQNAVDGGHRRFVLIEMDEDIAEQVTTQRVRQVADGYENTKSENAPGLGGGFQYYRLSEEPLFLADGSIRPEVTFDEVAEYIWFTETGSGLRSLPGKWKEKRDQRSPLLGVYKGTAIYLLYNGILKDKADAGGNVLNLRTLEILPLHDGPKIIYGARTRFAPARLSQMQIEFKQLPYELAVKSWV
jgi:site-specific DNA-methyltransferase (adenine-specific)/adenine-specific DNA-methyltransferase